MNTNKTPTQRHRERREAQRAGILGAMGLVGLLLLAGCASFDTATFRTEKALGDGAKGAVHAWNQYIAAASNQVSQAECVKLMAAQTQIYDASRKLGATLQVVEGLRVAYKANAANTNLSALQLALETAASQSGAIVELVRTFMGSSPSAPAKP